MADIKGFFGEYRFLSNYHIKKFTLDSVEFFCSEQAYMYQKTLILEQMERILSAKTPRECKAIGSYVTLREDWNVYRLYAMKRVICAKFKDPELSEMLLGTNDSYLEETNTWGDKFWGVCDGSGMNHLGKTLMECRSRISINSPVMLDI